MSLLNIHTDWLPPLGLTGVVLAQDRLAAPWSVHVSPRDAAVFYHVTEGVCWLCCAAQQPRRLARGDLVLLNRCSEHDVLGENPAPPATAKPRLSAAQSSGEHAVIVRGMSRLNGYLTQPMLRALPAVVHFSHAEVEACPQVAHAVAILTLEAAQPHSSDELLIHHLFDVLFFYIVQAWSRQRGDASLGALLALKDSSLSRALAHLRAEPASPWTVGTLAQVAGLSRATFARRFTSAMGEPPLAYLTRWRMSMACQLLATTEHSMAEVAVQVGYDSESSFSRVFKRTVGVAPAMYRRARQVSEPSPPSGERVVPHSARSGSRR